MYAAYNLGKAVRGLVLQLGADAEGLNGEHVAFPSYTVPFQLPLSLCACVCVCEEPSLLHHLVPSSYNKLWSNVLGHMATAMVNHSSLTNRNSLLSCDTTSRPPVLASSCLLRLDLVLSYLIIHKGRERPRPSSARAAPCTCREAMGTFPTSHQLLRSRSHLTHHLHPPFPLHSNQLTDILAA